MKAIILNQIVVRDASAGATGETILGVVAARGVRIACSRVYGRPDGTQVFLLVANDWEAMLALRDAGFDFERSSVAVAGVSDPRDKDRLMVELLRAGIGVFYFCAIPVGEGECLAVFKTSDNDGALELLRASVWTRDLDVLSNPEATGGADSGAEGCVRACARGRC